MNESLGLYSFATHSYQAFFMEEEDGRVVFQRYVGPQCWNLIPPVDELGGEETATVIQRLAAADLLVSQEQRDNSALRWQLGCEDGGAKLHPGTLLPYCIPKDYGPVADEWKPCTLDEDCEATEECVQYTGDQSYCRPRDWW